jgi:hypothetical protein
MSETQYKELLQTFLTKFITYADELRKEPRNHSTIFELRTELQRLEPSITPLLVEDVGPSTTFRLSNLGVVGISAILPTAIAGGNNEESVNFYIIKNAAIASLNHAIGKIDAGLWPKIPTLLIHDRELRERCADLLKAPQYYDRVIREATSILENRIRTKPSHEILSRIIPNSNDQQGRNLIDKLLNPDNPILLIDSDKNIRVKFRDILVGVMSYLRNPFHHKIDDQTTWSWAWSTVGFIDGLLNEIDNCKVSE